ncbi:MAG TPA: tetratricopeptide repeat protein, partial [Phycisphaerales bacterium]|nr:tetratricopeptide repeat protein [Phycisphaerales bacterium]
MKHSVAIFMIGLGLAGFSAAQARAETDWTDVAGMFNDPEFKKEFIAYYGFDAELEPRVTPEEVKVLESVREMMANDLPKAEATLRKQKPEGSAILSYTLGGVLFQEDKMDEAAEWYTKATDKFPSFRRAWRNMGLIQARGGKFDASIKSFTKMIELGGGDAYSYGLLGYCYSQKQDFQAAEAAYRSALLLQPENTEWRLGLTRCVFRQEKFEDAATLLDGLIERYPSNADFWALQAEAFLNMKQPIKAAENLEALDQMKKATPAHLFTLGDIYTTEDLFDLASNAYVRGVDADPKQAVARPLRSAEVLAARGALKEAKILSDEIHKVLEPQMVDADKHKLLKLDARLSLAEGGSSDETAAVLEE